MLARTLSAAQKIRSYCTWIHTAIIKICLPSGQTYYRTYDFDSTYHACRKCRKANQAGRIHSTGFVCEICGNPYASFVREHRTIRTGIWQTMRHCWGGGKRSH